MSLVPNGLNLFSDNEGKLSLSTVEWCLSPAKVYYSSTYSEGS